MIVCCGEALIDMLPRETAQGEPAFSPYSGGAVFNTAIGLGRLGADTGFWCGLSSDLFGQQLQEALQASHVDSSLCPISDRPTTLAFVSLKDGQAQYAFYDENTASRLVTKEELPQLPGSVQALFFGGISLVAEPCGSVLEAFMLQQSAHRVTMVDPNIRPSFITDESAYRDRIQRMMAASDIVKLSDEDLAWFEGDSGDSLETQVQALLARGTQLVVITRGGDEALAWTHAISARVQPPRVQVKDTVGAGDTFNAGLLDGLNTLGALDKERLTALSAEELESALSRAVSVAAVTVSRAGANPPWANELT